MTTSSGIARHELQITNSTEAGIGLLKVALACPDCGYASQLHVHPNRLAATLQRASDEHRAALPAGVPPVEVNTAAVDLPGAWVPSEMPSSRSSTQGGRTWFVVAGLAVALALFVVWWFAVQSKEHMDSRSVESAVERQLANRYDMSNRTVDCPDDLPGMEVGDTFRCFVRGGGGSFTITVTVQGNGDFIWESDGIF